MFGVQWDLVLAFMHNKGNVSNDLENNSYDDSCVFRGGDCYSKSINMPASYRGKYEKSYTNAYLGF